jgi:hypothetical protein
MLKADTALKLCISKHDTCLDHRFHRVAETIRANFPLVENLVSSVKKVFVKALCRKEAFKAVAPNVPLPPGLILTRCGTCCVQ